MNAGLYVHYPFCRKICPYCHFIKTVKRDELEKLYFEGIKNEIELISSFNLTFDTLYFGGGTPSLLKENLYEIVSLISQNLKTNFRELSIEVNPEDVDREFSKILKECGITRVSIGIQQVSSKILKILAREHSVSEIIRAIELLKKENFIINYDFIIGVPEEDVKDLEESFKLIDKFLPESASVYLLENIRGKYWQKFKELDEGKKEEHFNLFERFLESRGILRYEISNFAVKGKESFHNLKYWNYQNFVGIGPSAASLLNERRWENKGSIYAWAELLKNKEFPFEAIYTLSLEDRAKESIMMGLRKIEGINRAKFKREFLKFPEDFIPDFDERRDFFILDEFFRIKREYLLVFNSILESLFS